MPLRAVVRNLHLGSSWAAEAGGTLQAVGWVATARSRVVRATWTRHRADGRVVAVALWTVRAARARGAFLGRPQALVAAEGAGRAWKSAKVVRASRAIIPAGAHHSRVGRSRAVRSCGAREARLVLARWRSVEQVVLRSKGAGRAWELGWRGRAKWAVVPGRAIARGDLRVRPRPTDLAGGAQNAAFILGGCTVHLAVSAIRTLRACGTVAPAGLLAYVGRRRRRVERLTSCGARVAGRTGSACGRALRAPAALGAHRLGGRAATVTGCTVSAGSCALSREPSGLQKIVAPEGESLRKAPKTEQVA